MKVGEIYETNTSGKLKIVSYNGCMNVGVEFIDTGFRCITNVSQINAGRVKDKFNRCVFGVGYFGDGKYNTKNSKAIYNAWHGMIRRCYCDKFLAKNKTYIGCSVSEEFLNFQVFAQWCNQNGFEKGLCVDKDILNPGNKTYSPDTCCIVPGFVNTILTDSHASRGDLPKGVNYHIQHEKYAARINKNGKSVHIGYFSDPVEASKAYVRERKAYLKKKAVEWFNDGVIGKKVMDGLILHAEKESPC